MGAYDQNAAIATLKANLGLASYPSVPGTNIRLGSTAPTALNPSGLMTELSMTGYTPGGLLITWATPTGSPAVTSNTNSPLWTNSGTTAGALTGIEIWTTNVSPLRQFQGVWAGAPIIMPPGDEYAPAVGGIVLALG